MPVTSDLSLLDLEAFSERHSVVQALHMHRTYHDAFMTGNFIARACSVCWACQQALMTVLALNIRLTQKPFCKSHSAESQIHTITMCCND